MSSEAMSVVTEIAEDLDLDMDNVVMPEYKVETLYEKHDEDWFREYMRETLRMLK